MAAIDIAPGKMRLSLVYATLPVRIAASFAAPDPRAPFTVHADLGFAQADLPAEAQLAPDLAALPVLGRIGADQPALTGEVRLALAAIQPLRQPGPPAFVPLLRLAFVGADGVLHARFAFALGLPGGSGAVQPIRLDTGPRDIAGIAMRALALPAAAPARANFALDPARAAV